MRREEQASALCPDHIEFKTVRKEERLEETFFGGKVEILESAQVTALAGEAETTKMAEMAEVAKVIGSLEDLRAAKQMRAMRGPDR